jgi:hypothetical protein
MPPGKEPVDLVIDFLRGLKDHTMDVLESHFGKDFIEITPIEYFLTVPAVSFTSKSPYT